MHSFYIGFQLDDTLYGSYLRCPFQRIYKLHINRVLSLKMDNMKEKFEGIHWELESEDSGAFLVSYLSAPSSKTFLDEMRNRWKKNVLNAQKYQEGPPEPLSFDPVADFELGDKIIIPYRELNRNEVENDNYFIIDLDTNQFRTNITVLKTKIV